MSTPSEITSGALPSEGSGSGAGSLAGYDYQVDVSVWLALDLLLAKKLSREMVLEPSSEEDLEADLPEHAPDGVAGLVVTAGYRLVVQVKRRTGDAWTVNGIKRLLRHGSDTRTSAAKRLSSPDVRYLLVTTAALNGGARSLSVRNAGAWPPPGKMPSSIATALPVGAAGKVAVIGNQDDERLQTDIRQLLTSNFRVPNAKWEQCFHSLRQEMHVRIRGANGGLLRREDLQHVIRHYDGYIASSPELESYVHPTNWQEVRSAIGQRNAVLIIGQSGTGKTLASLKLYEELRRKSPGLSRVSITHGPSQLRADQTSPPVLYDIEDPWGRWGFDPESRSWNDQLATFFAQATHDRMIVVTSRHDVALHSGALDSVSPWAVRLESENYGPRERRRMYRTRIPNLPRSLHQLAIGAQKTVVAQLKTPLEIQKFFDAMVHLHLGEPKHQRALVAEAMRSAHHSAIERTVVDQIEHMRCIPAAAAIWALLKATSHVSLDALVNIEEELADRSDDFESGLLPLVGRFIAARNFRQNDESVSYYHPRVEAGIQQALLRHRLVARKAIGRVVDVLSCGATLKQPWGAEVATKVVARLTAELPELRFASSEAAQAQIDSWLAGAVDSPASLEEHLRLAAAGGSSTSAISELARFLYERSEVGLFGLGYWRAPERDATWYARLRSDPLTGSLLDSFVRNVLPTIRVRYPASFARDLHPLAPSLTDAFVAAGLMCVNFGVMDSDEAIAEGALQDIGRFEIILDAAVGNGALTDDDKRITIEQSLAITNGEYSEEHAEHLSNNDDGYTSGVFIRAYVARVRRQLGWQTIVQHRHAKHLLYDWLRDLDACGSASPLNPLEVRSAILAAYDTSHEYMAWHIALKHWQGSYFDQLRTRVHEAKSDARVREVLLACLVVHEPGELKSIVGRLAQQDPSRAACIAVDLAALEVSWLIKDNVPSELLASAIENLPAPFEAIATAAMVAQSRGAPVLSDEAKTILERASDATPELRKFRMGLREVSFSSVGSDVHWMLENTDDDVLAAEAVEIAARLGMRDALYAALDHRFARASAQALKAITASESTPFQARILEKAGARGSYIRRALVDAIDSKPHPAHLPTLLRLTRDRWSTAFASHGESSHFPIAQAAVDAIEKLGELPTDTALHLRETGLETSDPTLRQKIFRVIGRLSSDGAREDLLALAIGRGSVEVRRAAAFALLTAADVVSIRLLAGVPASCLMTQDEFVAASLAALVSHRADLQVAADLAAGLATHRRRRVLVLLMIWLMKERDRPMAEHMSKLLPPGHVATAAVLGDAPSVLNDATLADLGDAPTVAVLLKYFETSKNRK